MWGRSNNTQQQQQPHFQSPAMPQYYQPQQPNTPAGQAIQTVPAQQYRELEKSYKQLQDESRMLLSQSQALENENSSFKTQLDAAQQNFMQAQDQLEASVINISSLTEQNEQYQRRLINADNQTTQLRQQMEALQTENRNLKGQRQQIETASVALRTEKEQAIRERNEILRQKSQVETELINLRLQTAQLENEKTQLLNEKTRVENEKTLIENERQRLDGERSLLQSDKGRLESEKSHLEAACAQQKQALDELQNSNNLLRDQVQKGQELHSKLTRIIDEDREKAMVIEKELQSVRESLKGAQEESLRRSESLAKELHASKAELTSAQEILKADKLGIEYERVSGELRQAQFELDRLNNELQQQLASRDQYYSGRCREVFGRLATMEANEQLLLNEVSRVNSVKEEISNRLSSYLNNQIVPEKKSNNPMNFNKGTDTRYKSELARVELELREQLEKCNKDIQSYVKDLRDKNMQISELQTQQNDLIARNAELQDALSRRY